MKLVAQIIAGILLASLISWGFFLTFLYYAGKQIEEENKIIAHERSIKAAKDRARLQKQLDARKRKDAAIRKKKERVAKIGSVAKKVTPCVRIVVASFKPRN